MLLGMQHFFYFEGTDASSESDKCVNALACINI